MLTATTANPLLFAHHHGLMQRGHGSEIHRHSNQISSGASSSAHASCTRDATTAYGQTTALYSSSSTPSPAQQSNTLGGRARGLVASDAVNGVPPTSSGESPWPIPLGYGRRYSRRYSSHPTGAVGNNTGVSGGDTRRLQPHDTTHAYGEEDFEFLRNLLQEAGDATPAASPALQPGELGEPAAALTGAMAPSPAETLPPPLLPFASTVGGKAGGLGASLSASSAPSYIETASAGANEGSGGVGGPSVHEVTAEEKLQAADDVAACIWLAGDRVRDALLARVRGIWGTVEAEIVADAVVSATASGVSAAARAAIATQQLQQQPPRKNFRQLLVERLEATRKAVEMELRAADDAAAAKGECALVDPGRWRGSTAFRGDVLQKLESYQKANLTGAPVAEPRFSTANCRQDLLERLQGTKEAVVARVTASTEAACRAVNSTTSTRQRTATAPRELGGCLTAGLLEQLQENHAAAEEELRPSSGESSGDLRESLLEKLECTRVAAEAELLKDSKKNIRPMSAPASDGAGDCSSDGLGTQGSNSASSVGENAPTSNKSGKKRKRSGGGGRRCKHEGCTLHPHFGFTRPEYCSRHKLTGMFNVKGRRCVDPGCTRTPVYGKAGDPHPTFCAAHKLVDMVDIKNPTCRELTCSRQPSFGSPQDKRATFCASHMLNGMVNVRRMLASSKKAPKRKPAATGLLPGAGAGSGGDKARP